MSNNWLFVAAVLTALGISQAAQAQVEGVYTIAHFEFESGASLDRLKVGYITYGTLNAEKSNAILLVPATSSGRRWAESQIGPGKAYDTDKYFFIGTDAIGAGTSSQPRDGLGPSFPAYTIRDMVRAEYEMVTSGLGLASLRAIAGPSMGSFQALEWGIHYPGFMRGLVLIVPTARNDQRFRAIADAVRATITLDPAFENGAYTTNPTEGLRRAGTIYFPWLYSDDYLCSLGTESAYQKELWSFGDRWAQGWDADALLLRFEASRHHDVSIPFQGDMKRALASVKAQTILLVSATDKVAAADLSRELKDGLKDAEWDVIPSSRGHLAGALPLPGSPEEAFLALRIRSFLDRL